MKNKKFLPSAFVLYLTYFVHGIGCSVLGQAVIKESLAGQWGYSDLAAGIGAVTMVSASLGLGRLITLPFSGPLSDKLGRRPSTIIGIICYAIFFFGIAFLCCSVVAAIYVGLHRCKQHELQYDPDCYGYCDPCCGCLDFVCTTSKIRKNYRW